MRKRARLRISEDELDPKDHISSLPDDVLISILSRLTLKEAAVTSSLSRQWRYLWTQVTSLDFDGNSALDRIAADPKLRSIERPKYINWLNRVMRQYRGPTLDSVKICFDLDKNSKSAIDNWIKFAIAKRVQMLELDLLENGETLRQPMRNYTLPQKHLWPSKKGSSLKNVCSYVMRMQPCMSEGLKYLQALSLKCVNVSEETLGNLLSDCPVLQHLSIHGSGDLVNVKVSGTSLRLKHLELVFCLRLETIEISDVNLVSFSYLGHVIDLTIKNVPKLDEVSIGEGYSGLEKDVFGQLSCCLHQLESLTLDIYRPMENLKLHAFPELPNLKQLIIKVGAWEDDSLLELTYLIKQCQNLNRFVLQLIWMSPSKRRRKIRRAPTCAHTFLERVEIVGYYGRTSDAELVMYFIENAVALRKIIIDPRNQILDRSSKGTAQIKKEESARRCAMKQLETKKPPGVQLIIL